MSDTYTPNYNLILPAIGGDPNTWGTLLNENFSTIDTAMEANKVAAAAAQTSADAAAAAAANATPVGAIIFWNLAVAAIPTGWQLCDGTNGTPNMIGVFPCGSSGASGAFPEFTSGGANMQTLTVANMPTHAHPLTDNGHSHGVADNGHAHPVGDTGHNHGYNPGNVWGTAGGSSLTFGGGGTTMFQQSGTALATTGISVQSAHTGVSVQPAGTGISIGNNGSGTAFDNRPSWVALVMIQRMS